MNPLDLIPRWVLLLALAAAGIFAGAQTIRLSSEQADHATTKAEHAAQLQVLAENAREAEKKARAEEQRRTAEVQKAADEAEQARLSAQADAAAARDVGQRLRAQLAALTANHRGATGNPNAPRPGPAADPTADLLADVQRRLDEATDGIAQFADAARRAGATCERAYDALTP
jgi:hypothetical protein